MVYGEKNMVQLSREFESAQVSMFETFNEINTNRDFKVDCRYQRRLDTKRRYLDCRPGFMTRQQSGLTERRTYVRNGRDDPSQQTAYVKRMNEAFWSEMARQINSDPGLRAEFERLLEAKNALDALREARREQ